MSEICGSCGRNVADYYADGYRCAVCMGFKEAPALTERLAEMAHNHAAIGADGDARDIREALRVVEAAEDLAAFYRERSRHVTISKVIEALDACESESSQASVAE